MKVHTLPDIVPTLALPTTESQGKRKYGRNDELSTKKYLSTAVLTFIDTV